MSAHLGNRIPAAHINPMNERFPLKDTIEEGLCLFRWKVGVFKREKEIIHTEKDVLIIRKKEALQYQVIDTATKVCSFSPIPIPTKSTIDITVKIVYLLYSKRR